MKKILLLENGWGKYMTGAWVDGCHKYIVDNHLDAALYVINCFSNFSLDEKFNYGELNVFNLPRFEDFDGIILELTNITEMNIKRDIIERVIKSGVPCVSLSEKIPGMAFSGIDNYTPMKELVKNVVEVNGVRDLAFVGGPEYSSENILRMNAFKDVLVENGIEVDEERIYCEHFGIKTGIRGFQYFNNRKDIPRAFICANDNIAVGLIYEAKKYGYEVPRDFFVTGFDDFDKASFFSPTISTISYVREEMAYNAVRYFDNVWKTGQDEKIPYTKAKIIIQESTGCYTYNNPKRREDYVVNKIINDENNIAFEHGLLMMKRELINCNDFNEIAAFLPKVLSADQFEGFSVVLDPKVVNCTKSKEVLNCNDLDYPDEMMAIVSYTKGTVYPDIMINKRDLMPDVIENKPGDIICFSPLHFRDMTVGYFVQKNVAGIMNSLIIFDIMNTFNESMDTIYNKMIQKKLDAEIANIYRTDSLTGLYNVMAYKTLAEPVFNESRRKDAPVMVGFVDSDRLKYINDNYGHDSGNDAIKAVADAIKSAIGPDAIAMRYGGDEFVIVDPDCDKARADLIIDRIKAYLDEINGMNKFRFNIDASVGYVICDKNDGSLYDYIHKADDVMYKVKKKKGSNR